MNNKGNWHTTIRCQFFIAFRRENANKKRSINEQIQNIAQKKDTLCRRMYN